MDRDHIRPQAPLRRSFVSLELLCHLSLLFAPLLLGVELAAQYVYGLAAQVDQVNPGAATPEGGPREEPGGDAKGGHHGGSQAVMVLTLLLELVGYGGLTFISIGHQRAGRTDPHRLGATLRGGRAAQSAAAKA